MKSFMEQALKIKDFGSHTMDDISELYNRLMLLHYQSLQFRNKNIIPGHWNSSLFKEIRAIKVLM